LEGESRSSVAFLRLRNAMFFWESIGTSPFILAVIREGFRLDIPEGVGVEFFPFSDNRKSALAEAEFVASSILEWCRTGAVEKVGDPAGIAVFPLSVASNGEKLRLIHDLSTLNDFLPKTKFKLDDLRVMWHLLPVGDEASLRARAMQREVVRQEESREWRAEATEQELSEWNYWENRLSVGVSRALRLEEENWIWELETDASALALGWVLKGPVSERGSRNLSDAEKGESSTARELRGILFGVECSLDKLEGSSVVVRCDNQGAVSIMRKGRERGKRLVELKEECGRLGVPDLGEEAEQALMASVAPSTIRVYSRIEEGRRNLARRLGLEEDAEMSLCVYVMQKLAAGQAKSTLASALAAFGFATGMAAQDSRFGTILSAALKSAGRKRKVVSHEKVELWELNKILEWSTREGASRRDRRIGAACLLMFGCLLRVGEASDLKRSEVCITQGQREQILV
ncbi:hypothetical protein PMAYCL1PPCAC_11737, partial [Pristionchus mayeri]